MAPPRKATKRRTAKKARKTTARKPARKPARKAARKPARKAARKPARKAARKTTRKTTRKVTRKPAKKPAAAKPAATSRPKTVKFTTRKKGTFTQTDLIDHVQAWNPDLSKTQARQIVGDVLDTLQTAIKKTDRVRLKGIGTITKKKIPARRGGKMVKNPFTGELVKQKPRPASVRVKLSAATDLKKA